MNFAVAVFEVAGPVDGGFARIGRASNGIVLLAAISGLAVGEPTVAVFSRHVQIAVVAQTDSHVALGLVQVAVAFVMRADVGHDFAAFFGAF